MTYRESKFFRFLTVAAYMLPTAVLVTAYCAICVYTGNPWPWSEVVHESGDRTLIGTILYYQHAARELPLDVILGVAIASSVLFVFPADSVRASETTTASILNAIRLRRTAFAAATLIVTGTIIGGTLWTGGTTMLSNNLAQLHTRPGASLVWGAHWRYHLLSRSTLMLISFGFAGLVILGTKGKRGAGDKTAFSIATVSFGFFALLSVAFLPDLDPLRDPIFLGHQVREVFTHALVTLPLAWGTCLILARDKWRLPGAGTIPIFWSLIAGGVGSFIGFYLLLAALSTSAATQGQTQNVVLLVCPHFFEHILSYCVVVLVAGFAYESALIARLPTTLATE